jgi:hypothetical protein
MEAERLEGEFTMLKTMVLAAVAVVITAPVLAQESKMTLGEGESVFISPDGTLHKSNTNVSDANHEAALAKGANEFSRGAMFYRDAGKLYGGNCTYIGGWEQGYPGTENSC